MAQQKAPGPNDYHLKTMTGEDGKPTSVVEPGLGDDEPGADEKALMRTKSGAAMHRLKQELEAQTAELTEKEQALEKKQYEQDKKELELKNRESRLAQQEKELQAKLEAKRAELEALNAASTPPKTETGSGSGSISDL
jgi:hypothetical protein